MKDMMALKKVIRQLALFGLLILPIVAQSQEELLVEPPHWWTSMPSNELTVVLHEDGIASWTPSVREKSLRLKDVLPCDHPNYLWITLTWDAVFKASTITILLSRDGQIREVPYTFKPKNRQFQPGGLQADDIMYVIHPDRFANGDPDNDKALDSHINRKDPFARHGGDIEGVRQHLDHIKSLGVSAVRLYAVEEAKGAQPAFPESAITDHFTVDPRYGDTASYRRLIQRLHQMKMKIIKDFDYSFVGPDHYLIRELPFPDWLSSEQQEKLGAGKSPIAWNLANPVLRDYLTQTTLWWMEEFHLDALCLDHYNWTDRTFADHLIQQVETAYPGVIIYADIPETNPEILQRSIRMQSEPGSGGPALRHVVNYPLQKALEDMDDSMNGSVGTSGLEAVLLADDLYPDPGRNINFLDDRRTKRWFGQQGGDLDKFKAGLAVLATVRGIPAIYYGTEILMEQTKNAGKVSEDFLGGWAKDRRNKFMDKGRKKKEREAYRTLQRYFTWRSNNPAVTRGTLISYPQKGNVYIYFRRYGENLVMVVINGVQDQQELVLDPFQDTIRGYATARDILTGAIYTLDHPWSLKGLESRVLELER